MSRLYQNPCSQWGLLDTSPTPVNKIQLTYRSNNPCSQRMYHMKYACRIEISKKYPVHTLYDFENFFTAPLATLESNHILDTRYAYDSYLMYRDKCKRIIAIDHFSLNIRPLKQWIPVIPGNSLGTPGIRWIVYINRLPVTRGELSGLHTSHQVHW